MPVKKFTVYDAQIGAKTTVEARTEAEALKKAWDNIAVRLRPHPSDLSVMPVNTASRR